MSIEKKSLISTLKTTKKANIASGKTTNDGSSTKKAALATRRATLAKSSFLRDKM